MCGGSRLGFDRDGGAEVENGREEEMRKKREKRGSLAGPVGRHDLGGGAARSGLVRNLAGFLANVIQQNPMDTKQTKNHRPQLICHRTMKKKVITLSIIVFVIIEN